MSKFPKPKKRRKKPVKAYDIIRKSALERDNFQCQLRAKGCKGVSGPPHHIILKSNQGADITQNLISLCPSCHRLVHTNTKYYTPILLKLQQQHYPDLKIEDMKK